MFYRSPIFFLFSTSIEHTKHVKPFEALLIFSLYAKKGGAYDPSLGNYEQVDQHAGGHAIELSPAGDILAKTIPPVLFMAKSEKEKLRWVIGLQNLRAQVVQKTA